MERVKKIIIVMKEVIRALIKSWNEKGGAINLSTKVSHQSAGTRWIWRHSLGKRQNPAKSLLLIGGKLGKSGFVTEINLWGDILGNIEQNVAKKNH